MLFVVVLGAAAAVVLGKARGSRDASRRRWSPRGRRARAAAPALCAWQESAARGAGPATFSPVPEHYDRSFPPRGGIPSPRPRRALSDTAAPRAADILPQGRQGAATGSLDTLHAVDATHTRWATPTTASSSARTCYLQRAPPMRKTVLRKRTPRGMYHPDMLHREARRSCSTSTRNS